MTLNAFQINTGTAIYTIQINTLNSALAFSGIYRGKNNKTNPTVRKYLKKATKPDEKKAIITLLTNFAFDFFPSWSVLNLLP